MVPARYKVLWPLGKSSYAVIAPSPRLLDPCDKTIAILWDYLFRGEEIFPLIKESLQKRYPGIKFIDYPVFGNIHGPDSIERVKALPTLLHEHECDAVITGVGA